MSGDQPRVWNRAWEICPEGTLYVGRPTQWGNPFIIGLDGDRGEVIEKFRSQLADVDKQRIRRQLRGKHLSCWCAPKACHADVLLEIANGEEELAPSKQSV